ncbi:retinol dehydrogenase 7-like [Notechis scutatus]|uniref:Retinol dehydrogenase 7-like n=1 Tax=Notechis scutatus TaxID=8663 RepID=A0A6J1VAF0_9SAUR|nr:retinol dehydrogenase 7-like [Notechis scutatus]XP_026539666.1 retinol dehydrogenase 7-like [Notechis scutatus]XP_026539667.1 retinol dehydrogenase 7-like [Notechis scutatus]
MWLFLAVLVGLCLLCRWYWERQKVENLTEKYVFITGCDSGFGNQLARQLDARGLRVLASCLTPEGAEQLEKVTSDRLKTTLLDVTNTENVAAATEWVKTCVGDKGLWGLVNNAGINYPVAPNEWLKKEDFAKVLDVNLLGLIDTTLHMLPLVRRARGRVVNLSSVVGRLAVPGGGYCLSKFAVEAFSDTLRRELSPFGVRTSIIEPGGFVTNMLKNSDQHLQGVFNHMPPHVKEYYGQPYLDAYYRYMLNNVKKCSKNFCLVTDCIEHALTSRYPRTRYSAGWDAKFFFLPASYLPSAITDYLLSIPLPKPAQAV